MAKKKGKQAQQFQLLTPEKYIRQKARNLPIEECYVTDDWQDEEGAEAEVIVARRHANGNYTFCVYVVDTRCLGLKSSVYRFNVTPDEYESYISDVVYDCGIKISYNEAHNFIYGAIAFAEDYGIAPDKSFNLTQYVLEEDTEDIPFIEYNYGRDGRPYLIAETNLEASKYIPILDKSTGGDYGLEIMEDMFQAYKEREQEMTEKFNYEEEIMDYIDLKSRYSECTFATTPYTYQRPEYPSELNLTHPELNRLLTRFEEFWLSDEEIDGILALPRESLIADLKQIVLYGLSHYDSDDATMTHALFFLGELKAEEAFDEVMEVMRQDKDYMSIVFADTTALVLGLTLYLIANKKLPELAAYMKEPGLSTDFKIITFMVVGYVADEPGRRQEVLDWYCDLMQFYKDNADDLSLYDPMLGGMMIHELIDISPEEILPEIKSFVDTCKVHTFGIGDYKTEGDKVFERDLILHDQEVVNIHERYKEFSTEWLGLTREV